MPPRRYSRGKYKRRRTKRRGGSRRRGTSRRSGRRTGLYIKAGRKSGATLRRTARRPRRIPKMVPETKYLFGIVGSAENISLYGDATNMHLDCINEGIVQGTQAGTRVGNKITITSCDVRINIHQKAAFNMDATNSHFPTINIAVVIIPERIIGTAPPRLFDDFSNAYGVADTVFVASADTGNDPTTNYPIFNNTLTRYAKVLMHRRIKTAKRMRQSAFQNPAPPTVNKISHYCPDFGVNFRLTFKKGLLVQYGANAGVANDIIKNQLWMYMWVDGYAAGTTPDFETTSMTFFTHFIDS